ncbi:MAG: acetate--CoA ligase [Flavobacteriales bacterium]|nr:acetate--CoA ligase [Flavobacteriales bacterium]
MMQKINSLEEYHEQYKRSVEDPEGFWNEKAETFVWKKKWDKTLEWEFETPSVKWFSGGKMNITENCLDRHLQTRGDQVAILFEPNDPTEEAEKITYRELHSRVSSFANVLKRNGAKKGDRICLYMPMTPQLAIAALACARIGAIHSVVFAGFSARSLEDRINDATCNIVVTADGGYRGAKTIDLKGIVDDALENCPSVERCIVQNRIGASVNMKDGRDVWLEEELKQVNDDCPAENMDSEDMLFILYTSGSTGKPKGVVHTCGGYMVYAEYSFRNVFQYEEGDIYWCTADIGWVTGHSYIVYGPLLAGATTVMFEGVPTWPDAGRFWEVCDKHDVNIFYTAPTAIRALEAAGLDYVKPYKLDSLKVLGSVGEPINEEAWEWYHKHIGKGRCPIVDTWWQTETGGILISPLANITPLKPSFATLPLPGVQPCLVDTEGNEIEGNGVEGNLCIKFPWPSMLRTTYGDHERCKQVYFSAYRGKYFTGDGCRRDQDGFYRITGRVDDVINVSGHRFGTAEIEDAIDEHKNVVETAVVGYPHDIKGQGIYAYVTCYREPENLEAFRKEINDTVVEMIGPIAKPDKIQIVSGLPKTRSGKIMRRILRKVAEGDVSNLGDTSTLLDPAVVDEIKAGAGLK